MKELLVSIAILFCVCILQGKNPAGFKKKYEDNADGNRTTCYHLLVQLAMQEKRHYGEEESSGRTAGKMAAAVT